MTKTVYQATFSTGETITRRTERNYGYAWRLAYTARGETQIKTGFARTEALARACQSKEGPAEYDSRKRRWIADPSRLISFEIVPAVAQ